MFKSLLIANRGEIACRVIRTARRMGMRTIAVYSDADRRALHVRDADDAIAIGPASAKDSYLNIPAVIDAARKAGAKAVHPGYGFLSENAEFAEACAAAGVVFVGPPASAIRAMGSKSASKVLMAKAGVPLVPGYHGDDQSPELLKREAGKIGYPVLIKASAGGGGKGMKIVAAAGEFDAQLASAQREAQSSFGDAKVLIEKYLAKPRHVEFQVFADTHGNFVHLFERDCSIQRRHQKVIEEAPAPGMTEALRRQMGDAAVAAARAVSYVGAGTIEFLLGEDGQFYFMEMNTRLQVEHPVTELITGLDLVEWQLQVAAGARLPLKQEQLRISGHAIEARIYAEDPDREFLPQAGRIGHLRFAANDARYDHGVEAGATISPYYDPMIAKLAVHGDDRTEAVKKLRDALGATEISGIVTNVPFLARLASHADFLAGNVDTGFIERHRATLFPARPPAGADEILLAALGLFAAGANASPWDRRDGWRLNAQPRERIALTGEDGKPVTVELLNEKGGYRLSNGTFCEASFTSEGRLATTIGGRPIEAGWVLDDGEVTVFRAGVPFRFRVGSQAGAAAAAASSDSVVRAPMPGKISAVLVTAGQSVELAQPICVLEAMKMEHVIKSPRTGIIAEVACEAGAQVREGVDLVRFAEG
jgi:3-methylcrotonyl-CoA carboxylase alpha subunit